jgi:hypothetical protein
MAGESKLQLFFYDDNTFEFRRRKLEFTCLVEKQGDKIIRAWKHFYNAQFPFPGYKNMSAGMVTLGYSRDIILDPYDKVGKGNESNQKPNLLISGSLSSWIGKVAETMRHIYMGKRRTETWADRGQWTLIILNVVVYFLLFIKVAASIYSKHFGGG